MEQKIDELLKQLHKYLFADSEQVVNELRIYILDESLKEAELEFLRQNALQQDKLLASVKKKVYELLIQYLKLRSQECSPYLNQIKDTALLSFRSDTNSLVKESSLQLLVKIIETYNIREIEPLIKSKDMIIMLLDEIKLRKPSASVKGTIWTLVGLLHEKYGHKELITESQDVMFIQLQQQMKSDKPEIKAIVGIMKGFTHSLCEDCTLEPDQVEALYRNLKVAIQPIADMQQKKVMKAAMRLLGTHIRIFKKQITAHAIELVTITLCKTHITFLPPHLELCVNENMETRDTANEMLGQLIQQISEGLTIDESIHRDTFRNIMLKIQDILDDPSHTNVLLISTIKAVGIFSKAIKKFSGDEHLYKYLEQLIQVSENKIIKEFETQEDPKNDFKNFKQILKKQKQLISFIESYSFILQNLDREPQEAFLLHFSKVCEIGVRHHRKLYPKYRERFYEALASFTKALAFHRQSFALWIKKFVRNSLIETLKIPDAVIFGGESPYESLLDAVQFWRQWLNKDQIWSDFTCQIVYDELITTIIERIEELNLTYKVEKGKQAPKEKAGIQENYEDNGNDSNQNRVFSEQYQGLLDDYVVSYIANNNTDQQFLVRLSNFAEMFLLECKTIWFLRWVNQFCGIVIKKAQQTPRISKLYSLLKVSMQICSIHKFFDTENDKNEEGIVRNEKLNTYNMLLTFFKELIGKQEEYQDELLISCLDLLLHVPVQILYRKDRRTDNVQLWKGVMFKALDLGRGNKELAMNSVTMVEQWFNLLPMNLTVDLYQDILPKLSDYLYVDDDTKAAAKMRKSQEAETFQVLEMLKTGNEVNIERRDIALKVLDLLGKIGGHAHQIINNDQNKLNEKENFIKWDPEKRLKFTLPLYTKKIDIYFDAVLPKLVDLAQNSTDRETRVAACEFLHALVIYMIGKNATQPKMGRNRNQDQSQEIAPFAKIYKKLFPVIIKLATEVENISRQLFEPLIFQIVRWFSSSRVYEHPEVESLLDALIEGASSRNNSALREMCSNAVAEFAKWSLKQMTDKDIRDNPNNIKSLIRRIESNSNHPDPFKRLSSVLCFQKIFSIIREFDPLIDRFCLEIAHNVLASLKMCHNSLEFSQEVIDNCSQMLLKISKVCQKKMHLLMPENKKRSIHPQIFTFILYLFEKFTAVETVFRRECMKLWEALVKSLPPQNQENMPQNLEKWVFEYYLHKRGDKSIFKRWQRINFKELGTIIDQQDQNNGDSNPNNQNQKFEIRKTLLSEKQKAQDQLTAQMECFTFLLHKKIMTYEELSVKLIEHKIWVENLRSFINDNILVKYNKNHLKTFDKLLICKEDKEQLTKARMILITQFFKYLLALDNKSLLKQLDEIENDDFELPLFCMQILLIPSIHQLNILVEDPDLERQLRHQCELVLKKLIEITNLNLENLLMEFVLKKIPVVSLKRIKPTNPDDYHPKILTSLCLGYLKLGGLDQNIRNYLIGQKHLFAIVEEWLQKESPIYIESTRIVVKFLSKLEIPNEIISDWLTFKPLIYQKTGDIILSYIAENWNHPKLHVGEYLTFQASQQRKIYAVFLPILEMLNEKTPNYSRALFLTIPKNWQTGECKDFEDFEVASNQIKIYSFIVANCKAQLNDASNPLAQEFLDHLCLQISHYFRDKYPVNIKKEVLNLIGLIYNMQVKDQPVSEVLDNSIKGVQRQFFPIKTKELQKNSHVWNNFHVIIDGFMNLLLLSKNLKVQKGLNFLLCIQKFQFKFLNSTNQVLRILYRSIREHKTTYEVILKRTLNVLITQHINKYPLQLFKQTFAEFLDEFLNRDLDKSIDDNLRWAILRKIILKILETCDVAYLTEIMIQHSQKLEKILQTDFESSLRNDPLEFYLLVKEKTRVFLIYEVMFRRIKAETIRTQVHKRLYGEQSPGNELTKSLIQSCSKAKRAQIEGFLFSVKDKILSDIPLHNSPLQVQRQYICAAYSCLTAVIMSTQTKENLFSQFLFVVNREKGEESLWALMVDLEKQHNFEVETNFSYIQLKTIEKKIEQSFKDEVGDISELKAQNLINQYVTTSFMSANEKFNSAMIFETQPDKFNLKSEEEKLQRLLIKKKEAADISTNFSSSFSQSEYSFNQNEPASENNFGEGLDQVAEQESVAQQFELDNVNRHECMKNIKRCIDKMKELFSKQWEGDKNEMPLFMQCLNQEIRRQDTHLNVKIFILKLLVNKQTSILLTLFSAVLFSSYASHWFEPIANYICDKNNGGKGFHYFLRDLCTLIISWNFVPEDTPKNRLLCTNVVNVLVKYGADKTKMIFNTNIQIIAGMLHRWKKLVAVGKETLSMMIGMDEKKEGSNLWKMTGIQILALVVSFDIPLLENVQNVANLNAASFRFQLEDKADKGGGLDKIFTNLLKIQSYKKKQIIQAASETLGKILAKQPELVKYGVHAIMENENNDRHDILVNSIEKVSREYPQILDERRIFMKMISFVKVLTGTMRNAIFKTLERYVTICRQRNNRDDIDKITLGLFADSEDILSDISDENQQSFLLLVTQITKLNTEQGDKLINKIIPRLKQLFVNNKNDYSRGLFYDLMVFLYDQFEAFRPQVKSALIRGLNDKSKLIRDKLIGFWSDPARLELDAIVRLNQIMDELYTQDEESIWLNNSAFLLMSIANKSSDFERKIFDQPLQNCKFHPLEINQFGHNINRSQPLTPFFSQMDQAFQSSQAMITNQNLKQILPMIKEEDESEEEKKQSNKKDVEMIDNSANKVGQINQVGQQKFQKPNFNQSQGSQQVMFGTQYNEEMSDSQFYNGNVLRATQIPQFTQTQTDLSSLIASNFVQSNSPPFADSISASFYEVNRLNKRSPQQKAGQQKQGQIFAIKTQNNQSSSQDQDQFDEEGFLMPISRKKRKKDLSKFFAQNQYVYRPQESQGDRIRYIPQGSMSSQSSKQEEIRNMQREQFLNRQKLRLKKQVNLYRKYRVGELPDIQINYKDVLLPLSALIKNDSTIATEIFVEVFAELYRSLQDKETRIKLGDGVKSVLGQSIMYEYGCINCMHRVAMELLKTDGFSIQAEIIQRTGQHSMSFQTALALIEETIIKGKSIQDDQYLEAVQGQQKRRKKGDSHNQMNRMGGKQFVFSSVFDGNRSYWFNMIDLYEQIGNNDALQGIWSFLADEEGIIFKKPVVDKAIKDKEQSQGLSQEQERTVNLIKEAQVLRNKGSINEGLKVLEQALNDPKLTECLEDHIKIELQNKRLDSKAELQKWDEIAQELNETYFNKKLQDIPFLHSEKLIKSQIRHIDSWKHLNREIEFWQHDGISKAYLDKNFNFEVALNALTCKDYDRARFYLDRETNELISQWKNLTKLSQVSQHIIVQRIQKLFEMREFLSIVKSEGIITKEELIPRVVKSISNWSQRVPSYAFDTISVWDDILVARNLYLDLYKYKLGNGLNNQLSQKKDLKDIDAILYVQCAKGSFKMGMYDSSDRFLKKALNLRGEDSASNMKIVAPVIKLKCEQFKGDTMNLDFQAKSDRLYKILQVLDKKMKQSFGDQINEGHSNVNVDQVGDINLEIKSLLLRQRLEKKMLNIILQGSQVVNEKKEIDQLESNCSQYLQKSFGTLQLIMNKVKMAAQYDDQMKNTMAKIYFKLAQFSDKILRKMENEKVKPIIQNSLKKMKSSEQEIARQSIRFGLKALNLEYQKASDIIPRLLDIVSNYKESVASDFIAHSKDTPAWFFLRWINQIVAVINRQESQVIEDKVVQIAKRYPQALFYPFKVIESNTQVNVLDAQVQKTQLFSKLSKFFEKSFRNLNSWVEALDGLVYPEHRYKYWSQILTDLLESATAEHDPKPVPKSKIKEIVQLMIYDLVQTNKNMIGDRIGSYNRKFAEKWEKQFNKCFGIEGANIDKLNLKQILNLVGQFSQKVSEASGQLGQGYEKVSTFSEWLDGLDINDFYNPYEYIELPGQYEGLKAEPLVDKNVKIASVRKSLLILGSIRRPKRLTVHGSNEKDYHLLVKGGEDLRLDQRVQQLFQIMNSIFKDDAQCQNRDLYIKIFKVVPITNRLGTLEWVDDTEPMKNIINREHVRVEGGKDLNQSRALALRRKWLKDSVPGNQKKDNIAEQHLMLLGCDEKIVSEGYKLHKDAMPWFLLRNGLENLCLTSSAFLSIKNQFTKSLATFSIASYLIGIGDRHLENFLIDTSDGEILGIDFGIAFGSGVQLGIPELMPFRLTQQIEGVIAPHPLDGVYKQTMVHALTALKKRRSLILDTCEIFVKEPLLDWVKDAKQKQKSSMSENENQLGGVSDSLISQYEEELKELSWYPRQKIEIVKDKLQGLHPVKILAKELKDTKHERRPYVKTILRAIEGGEGSHRHQFLRQRKRYLEVDEYVDCLIEQARDPNILGRTWIGWSPYV